MKISIGKPIDVKPPKGYSVILEPFDEGYRMRFRRLNVVIYKDLLKRKLKGWYQMIASKTRRNKLWVKD